MTRAVLATVVAAALLAAALPAVDSVRTDRTSAAMERATERIQRAGAGLLASDAADAGARRVVSISLPVRSLASAGVEQFAVSCSPDCAVHYRLTGGHTQRHLVRSVPLATPGGPVRFAEPGHHRLVLGVTRDDGARVVTVRA